MAEDLDIDASDARAKLTKYLSMNKLNSVFKYTGPDQNRDFVATITFLCPELRRPITGRGTGTNKQKASESCAINMIRWLHSLGVHFEREIEPYPVAIQPDLYARIQKVLEELKVEVPTVTRTGNDEPVSLLSKPQFANRPAVPAGVVSWSSPRPNWNPWTGCKIDEGPLATANLDDLSDSLCTGAREKLQSDTGLQRMISERESLPVFAMKRQIMEAINGNSVIIIRGNTGCGKTTQVCQFILDDYIMSRRGAYCNVMVIQPRDISTISAATRIAEERMEDLGASVGFTGTFESCLPRTYGAIMLCTVGVLLRKLEAGLHGVSHVIIDEIHERDVNTDLMLVIISDIVRTYPYLRVILISAPIDTNLFSGYFKCPVLEVEGRAIFQTFFLEDIVQMLNFEPPSDTRQNNDEGGVGLGAEDDDNMNLEVGLNYSQRTRAAIAAMNEKDISFELIEALLTHCKACGIPGAAALVFLQDQNVIFALMKHLQQNSVFRGAGYVVLPLHSNLSRDDLRSVFQPGPDGVMKIILSTNIAETSINIRDVVFIIDTCKVKMELFTSQTTSPSSSYAIEWASRSNLELRKDRVGQNRHGIIICRLLTKARFDKLNENMTPEMFRTSLHEVALLIKLLRLGSIRSVFSKGLVLPPLNTVIQAEFLLKEMKCLDENDELTPLGKMLARLPIEPRLGKMMILGCIFGVGDALSTIAANSSTFREVFITEGRLTDSQKAFAWCRCSDHLAMLNVFNQWPNGDIEEEEAFYDNTRVSQPALRVTADAKSQLKNLMTSYGFPEETISMVNSYHGYDINLDIITALLSMGLHPNVCYREEKGKVLTESKPALIHETSVNYTEVETTFPSPFFVFGEKIRTRAVSCKQTTMVTPIHLLLFGSRKVELVKDLVRLDNWINLKMDLPTAMGILSLRTAVDVLVEKATMNPVWITHLSEVDKELISIIKDLCRVNAGRHGLVHYSPLGVEETALGRNGTPPEPKHMRGNEEEGSVAAMDCLEADTEGVAETEAVGIATDSSPNVNIDS